LSLVWQQSFVRSPPILGSMRTCQRAGRGSSSLASGGSTLVILEDGGGLDVRSTMPSKVYVYEFKTKQERATVARNASNPSEAMRLFEMVLGVSSGSRLTLRLDLTRLEWKQRTRRRARLK
jgi:hypothetical protein